MSITVRPAGPADAGAIHRLNVAFNDARATPAYIAESIVARAQYERLFVALLDREVVGMAGLRLLPCALDPEPYAELTESCTSPRAPVGEASGGRWCRPLRRRHGRVELPDWCYSPRGATARPISSTAPSATSSTRSQCSVTSYEHRSRGSKPWYCKAITV